MSGLLSLYSGPRSRWLACTIGAMLLAFVVSYGLSVLVTASGHKEAGHAEGAQADRTQVVTGAVVAPLAKRRPALSSAVISVTDPSIPGSQRLQLLVSGNVIVSDDVGDIRALCDQLLDRSEGDTLRNETCNLLLRDVDPAQVLPVILAVIESPHESERFRSFAVQGLVNFHKQYLGKAKHQALAEQAYAKLVSLLQHPEDASRREALWALAVHGHPLAVQQLDAALYVEPPSVVTDLAIRLLRQQDEPQHQERLRELVRSDDTAVAIAAIEALGAWHDQASRAVLKELLDDGTSPRVSAAHVALRRLDQVAVAAPRVALETEP